MEGLPDIVGTNLLRGRELGVTRQSVADQQPGQPLRLPIVKGGWHLFRTVETSDRNIDEAWNVLSREADLRAATRTETASTARRRFVD